MPLMGEKFTVKNNAFGCEICGKANEPAPKTCRNHCRFCLYSKHVDVFPGDRANRCQGVFVPIGVEFSRGEISDITFLCQKCGQKSRNKIADDDDREALFRLLEKSAGI